MKRLTQNMALIGATLLSALPSSKAEVKENPFTVIVERNAFRLKPPPPPAPPASTNAPPPPPSNVRLTGVYEWSGVKKALLEITDPVSKKVEHPPALTEGEEQGQVKILSIDVTAGKVQIQNGTELATLGFETPKTGGAGPGGGMPSPAPGMPVPLPPGIVPAAPTLPSAASAGAPGAASRRNVVMGGANAAAGLDYGAGGMPARPLRTSTDSGNVMVGGYGAPTAGDPSTANQSQAPVLSREELQRVMQVNYQTIQAAEENGTLRKGISSLMPVPQNMRKAGAADNASPVPGLNVNPLNPNINLPTP